MDCPSVEDFDLPETQLWLEEHACYTIDERIMGYCTENEYNLKEFVADYRAKYPDEVIFDNEEIDES